MRLEIVYIICCDDDVEIFSQICDFQRALYSIPERVETEEGARYQVALDSETMRPFLEEVAPRLARWSENARFIFNDESRQLEVIQPAVIGRTLDVDATLQKINQQVAEGDHNLELVVNFTQPQVGDDASGEDLGIRELVASHTSYFYGSSGSRIQNIQVAASRFHGVLVPPGATFSMAEVLGTISLDDGYAEVGDNLPRPTQPRQGGTLGRFQ
ncbi:MAG: VanW family protein, partial [Bacteroidales bacterium]